MCWCSCWNALLPAPPLRSFLSFTLPSPWRLPLSSQPEANYFPASENSEFLRTPWWAGSPVPLKSRPATSGPEAAASMGMGKQPTLDLWHLPPHFLKYSHHHQPKEKIPSYKTFVNVTGSIWERSWSRAGIYTAAGQTSPRGILLSLPVFFMYIIILPWVYSSVGLYLN